MSQKGRFLLFFLIVFSLLFGGTLRIGVLSFRHICMLILVAYSIKNWSKVNFGLSGKLYLVYLGFYLFASFFNGELYSFTFLQSFFTYHLPCLSMIMALPLLIKNESDVRSMSFVITVLFLFNAIVTVFQYYGSPIAWAIGNSISEMSEEHYEVAEKLINSGRGLLYSAVITGITGFVVSNGYFCATFFPVVTKRLYGKFNVDWVWPVILLAFSIFTIVLIQQRTSFYLTIVYLAFFLVLRSKMSMWLFVIFLIVSYGIYGGLEFGQDVGRLSLSENIENRMSLFDHFYAFLDSEYMFWGGLETYMKNFGMVQHNTLLASWVYGGFLSFLIYCVLYFQLFFSLAKKVFKNVKLSYLHVNSIAFGCAGIIYLLFSLSHSDGVHNGSTMFWFVYLMFVASCRIEEQNKVKTTATNQLS